MPAEGIAIKRQFAGSARPLEILQAAIVEVSHSNNSAYDEVVTWGMQDVPNLFTACSCVSRLVSITFACSVCSAILHAYRECSWLQKTLNLYYNSFN